MLSKLKLKTEKGQKFLTDYFRQIIFVLFYFVRKFYRKSDSRISKDF